MKIKIYVPAVVLIFTSVIQISGSVASDTPSQPTTDQKIVETITVTYQPSRTNQLSPNSATLAATPSPCILQVQNIYLRQSFGYGAVGTKAMTTCSVQVTSINHDTYIQKMSFIGWNTQKVFSGSAKLTTTYSQLDVAVPCTNGLSTTWTGYTNGVVVYKGVQYYATVRVANISASFACGT